jgi:hypothetical protein
MRALHTDALVAVETMNPDAVERANSNRRARQQLRQLLAAALRDVAGWPLRSVNLPEQSIAGALDYSGRSAAQRAVLAGRRLWPTLAAWPWWDAGATDGGPFEWWTDPPVIERLEVWRSPP